MNKYFYISFFILSISITYSQNIKSNLKTDSTRNPKAHELIFDDIETGIKEADVRIISKYFGQQTYFSFSNGISGYYSNNQAYYVLEDFFKLYKVTSFRFEHIKRDKNICYATGKYNYDSRGQRNSAQVYISLKKIGHNWNITQFTIN